MNYTVILWNGRYLIGKTFAQKYPANSVPGEIVGCGPSYIVPQEGLYDVAILDPATGTQTPFLAHGIFTYTMRTQVAEADLPQLCTRLATL
jgi:hypothetical protein